MSSRLSNPAKTLADLPAGAQIRLHQYDWVNDDGTPMYGYAGWVNADGTPWMGRRGTLEVEIRDAAGVELADLYAERYPSGYHPGESRAKHGWGPLAYDILMERATELGSSLGAGDASPEARALWEKYMHRPDVTATYEPLVAVNLDELRPFKAGNYMFRKQPKLLHELAGMRNVVYEGDWPRPRPRSAGRVGNPAERTALDHARALEKALAETPGAPRGRAWAKPGVGARVYFPTKQYLLIGRDGTVRTTDRGRATFLESSLYPSQRAAYRVALKRYLDEHRAYLEAAWDERQGNPTKSTTMKNQPAKTLSMAEEAKLHAAHQKSKEQPLAWAAWQLKSTPRHLTSVRDDAVRALRSGGYVIDGKRYRVGGGEGGDGLRGTWVTPLVLTKKGEQLASTWSAAKSKALEQKWAKQDAAFKARLGGPAAAPRAGEDLDSKMFTTLMGAKHVAVSYHGTIEGVSALLWTLAQGRGDAVLVVDTPSKVLRSYGKALAKTYGVQVLSEAELLKRWTNKRGEPLGGVVLVQGTDRKFLERRDDPGPYRGAIGIGLRVLGSTPDPGGYELLDVAGVRPPPQHLFAPTAKVRDWAVQRGLTDAMLLDAARKQKADTFEKALAVAMIQAGDFPESLVIFNKDQKRERLPERQANPKGKISQSRRTQRALEKELFGPEPKAPRYPKERVIKPSKPLPPSTPGDCRFCGNVCAPREPWTCSNCGVTYDPADADAEGWVHARKQNPARPNKKALDAAVLSAQLYAASDGIGIKAQQRLYDRMMSRIDKIATSTGMDASSVSEQIFAEARRRGRVTPKPGKDY